MKSKLITIDFWNTLYNSTGGRERNAYRQKALVELLDSHAGRIVMGDEIENAIADTWKYFEKIWKDEQRTIGAEESVDFLLTSLKAEECKPHRNNLVTSFADSVLKHPPILMDDADKVLKDLSSEYKLSIISDTGFSPGTVLLELMERDGIAQYFDHFSFSDETGYSKPHPEAFKKAVEPTGLAYGESTHIGDIEHTDIKGAKELGMNAIRFTGNLTDFATFRHSAQTIADHEVKTWREVAKVMEGK
jgi:putative hydrolase of the HAD superfamily